MRNHLKGYLPDAAIYVAPVLLIFSISLRIKNMGEAIFLFWNQLSGERTNEIAFSLT